MPASSTLVDRLRRMTAVGPDQYTIGNETFWGDEDLQGVLESRVCAHLVQAEVRLVSSIAEDGALQFVEGQIDVAGTLDADTAIVVDLSGAKIEDATVHGDGRVEFAEDQSSSVALLSGLCYDLNGAAADVLTDWASAVQLGYDISTDGQSMKRSQRHAQLLAQAEAFRARAVIGSISVGRSDVRPSGHRGSRTAAARRAFGRIH